MSKGDSDDYAAADKHKYLKVTFDETKRFMVDCLKSAGASPDNAKVHSDCLFDADYKGFVSHGMNRLGKYLRPHSFINCLSLSTQPFLELYLIF